MRCRGITSTPQPYQSIYGLVHNFSLWYGPKACLVILLAFFPEFWLTRLVFDTYIYLPTLKRAAFSTERLPQLATTQITGKQPLHRNRGGLPARELSATESRCCTLGSTAPAPIAVERIWSRESSGRACDENKRLVERSSPRSVAILHKPGPRHRGHANGLGVLGATGFVAPTRCRVRTKGRHDMGPFLSLHMYVGMSSASS
ncbi:hypothetical protein GGS23DRAFT_556733, partial [Durotheca rogersii]|uniref:uncharacterized protein n=1 Tax=Durotheca rogersii TaxID=419775 RepID=UPI00221E585D